jgi:hypothetical protein
LYSLLKQATHSSPSSPTARRMSRLRKYLRHAA